MARFSIVTKIRLIGSVAPLILLLATPLLAAGLYFLGQTVPILRDHALMAMQAARGMEIALYRMEWGVTQPGADEILLGQRRQFLHWLELAQDRAESDEQRRLIVTIGQRAGVLLEQLPAAGQAHRMDDSLERAMRELHGTVNDLTAVDDAMIGATQALAEAQARRLIAVLVTAGLLAPWLAFVGLCLLSSPLRGDLRAMRLNLEKIVPRLAAANLAADAEVKALDDSLTRLGFPPPNPMLAE